MRQLPSVIDADQQDLSAYTTDNAELRMLLENKNFHEAILGERTGAYALGTRKLPDQDVYVLRLHVEGDESACEDIEFNGKKMILITEGGLEISPEHRKFMQESRQNSAEYQNQLPPQICDSSQDDEN